MFQLLFALNEMRPSVQAKRVGQRFAARQAGRKQRNKALLELSKLTKPEYEMPEFIKTKKN